MKSLTIAVLVVMLMGSSLLIAQEEEENIEIIIEEAMEDLEIELDNQDRTIINISEFKKYDPNSPKMGIFPTDLDFKDIYELHYDYNYGVYLAGVTTNGPADKAGLMEGDILMEFDGNKIRFEDHLIRMIRSHEIGDEIKIKFYRDEAIYETVVTLDTLEKKSEDISIKSDMKKRKRINVGGGGGGWIPVWFMPDVTDINNMLSDLGFKAETFSEDGFLLQGGGGKGNVGKGWFLGGMGAGYSNKETSKHEWTHFMNGEEVTSIVSRKVKYDISYGGVTLDKRLGISRNIITSLGFMIGWGSNQIKLIQTDDNGSLPNFDFDDPSVNLDEFYDFRSKLKLNQDFILFQPKAMLMFRILEWLSIRSEVGYMLSHSTDGWKAKWNGERVKLENAPDSTLDGLTITIGPWFGF